MYPLSLELVIVKVHVYHGRIPVPTPLPLIAAEPLPTLRSDATAAHGRLPTLNFDNRYIKDADE